MIFVTVGEQLPFDRLVRAVDVCAIATGQEIIAQIGESTLIPDNIEYKKFLNPQEFEECFMNADVIIAHAGMGTIITALELGKPLIVMPRQADLGEHRNDHQFATAKRFLALNYIMVAFTEAELAEKITRLVGSDLSFQKRGSIDVDPLLINSIVKFIES